MDAARFDELVADILAYGQLQPITLCDGKLLDGRNRYRACITLGLEPITCTFDGDPWAYTWSYNAQRRDLVLEQRYLIWKYCHEHSEAWQSEKQRIADEANRKRREAAKEQPRTEAGVFQPVVQQSVAPPENRHKAEQAKATASKTNTGAVARGDKLAKDRPDLADQVRKGDIRPSEAHRQMRRDEVAKKAVDLPDGKFRVIYSDPPWKYNDDLAYKPSGHLAGAASMHYPTLTLAELKALDVPKLTADDAVLFLWATCPLLEDALDLARAWGFRYKAQFVWDKVKHNMGHYNSVRHELLLICTKGSATPEVSKLFDSVQVIERTAHSAKPEQFREIIDTLYPSGPRIELFCRGKAPNEWQAWGAEFDECA